MIESSPGAKSLHKAMTAAVYPGLIGDRQRFELAPRAL